MSLTVLLFDVAPAGSSIVVFLGVAFFFICLAVAVIAFKVLKKSVKMAVRLVIVAAILIAALIGSLAFFWFGSPGENTRPTRETPKSTQTPQKTR